VSRSRGRRLVEQSARNASHAYSGFFVGLICCNACVPPVNDDTGVFMRERAAGLYRLSAYYLAVMTTEIPVSIILPTIYAVINYWMCNLSPGAVNFIGFWLILVLSTFTAQVSVSTVEMSIVDSRPSAQRQTSMQRFLLYTDRASLTALARRILISQRKNWRDE
jgi:hypothetical protein